MNTWTREQWRLWYANLPEWKKELRRITNRARYAANRETEIARRKQHYRDHRAVQLARSLKYQRDHWNSPYEIERRKWNRIRRRTKEHLTYKRITAEEWRIIQNVWEHKCAYCRSAAKLTQDHLIPISKGGRHILENIVPACGQCNSRKSAKDLEEFLAECN